MDLKNLIYYYPFSLLFFLIFNHAQIDQWETLQANSCVLFVLPKKHLCVYFWPRQISAGTQAPRRSWGAGLSLAVACGFSCPSVCGLLVPRPGIKPVSPALDGKGKCLLFALPSRLHRPWSYRLSLCSPCPDPESLISSVLFGEKRCLETNA